jgi:hypothetical protein
LEHFGFFAEEFADHAEEFGRVGDGGKAGIVADEPHELSDVIESVIQREGVENPVSGVLVLEFDALWDGRFIGDIAAKGVANAA